MDTNMLGNILVSYAISIICVLIFVYYNEKKIGLNFKSRDEGESRGRMMAVVIAVVLMSVVHGFFLHAMKII